MNFAHYFPMWEQLTRAQQEKLEAAVSLRKAEQGTILHNGSMDCMGLMLVQSGQLRAFILSKEGREISIFRLFERDVCLLSAPCMIPGMQLEVTVEAEKDSEIWVIPPESYRKIMEESAPLANYTNQIIASRFSEVMWLIEQIMWKSFDKRLAQFLLDEAVLEGTEQLKITHEKIGNHLGTAREVVTRMLRYFQSEGLVKLSRGTVEITDLKGLGRI